MQEQKKISRFSSNRFCFVCFAENKSILTDGDWKKLWMEAGNLNPSSKTDNTLESSDSPVFDDTEVSKFFKVFVSIRDSIVKTVTLYST